MKVTLQIGEREMTFSEKELIEILEKHFANQKETQEQEKKQEKQKTAEGKYFDVIPKDINPKLFSEKREDPTQEWTRQIILEAFANVSQKPEKYAKPFKTMIPKKTWSSKTVKELKEFASNLGNHMADWVEQALEWAQRIANGETWEAVCNQPDTSKWYRLIIWKNGYARNVGGTLNGYYKYSASVVSTLDYDLDMKLGQTVPLIVLYE